MRHIMIDLFTSLGQSCANIIPTTSSPDLKDRTPPTFCFFALKTIYSFGRFKRGSDYLASRSWILRASLLIDTIPLLLLQPTPNFAKMLASHDAQFIVIILFLSTSTNWFLHTPPWTAALPSNKPSTEFIMFEFHQHLGAAPKALHRKKRIVLYQRSGLWKRPQVVLEFLSREEHWLNLKDAVVCCVLEIEDRENSPSMQMRPLSLRLAVARFWHRQTNERDSRKSLVVDEFLNVCCFQNEGNPVILLAAVAARIGPHPPHKPRAPPPNPVETKVQNEPEPCICQYLEPWVLVIEQPSRSLKCSLTYTQITF